MSQKTDVLTYLKSGKAISPLRSSNKERTSMVEGLKTCPCGGAASVRRDYDDDGALWHFVECGKCGLRTRGQWVSSSSNTCPIYFEGVRNQWNDTMNTRHETTTIPDEEGRIEGLQAELDEAVQLLWKYGAKEYVEMNYPSWAMVLVVSERIQDDPNWVETIPLKGEVK